MEDQTKFHPDPKLNPKLNPKFKIDGSSPRSAEISPLCVSNRTILLQLAILRYIRFYSNTIHPRNLEYIDVEKLYHIRQVVTEWKIC